jgi:hypothetical protein
VITCGKYNENSLTGIGTASPTQALHVKGNILSAPVSENDVRTFGVYNGSTSTFDYYDTILSKSLLRTGATTFTIKSDGSNKGFSAIQNQWRNLVFYTYSAAGSGDIAVTDLSQYERMRITSEGNVGIGTASPGAKLQVGGNAETSPQYLWIRGSRVNQAGEICGIHFYNSANSGDRGNSRIINSRGTNNYGSNLEFWTNPDDNVPALERMRILANGNVGIGKTNPNIPLDVGNALENPRIGRDLNFGSVHDADKRDSVYFGRRDGTDLDFLGMQCRVDTHTALGYGSYSNQTKIGFHTWGNNYAGSREVMCINGAGNVGIGTVSPTYGKLHVNGAGGGSWYGYRYFNYGSNPTTANFTLINTSIFASGGIVAGDYVAASDTRIKKNIVDANDVECLEVLRLLRPKKYQYKDEVKKGEEPVWGFIAQEVRETLPYATKLLKDVLPNIYELANVSQSNVITFVNFNTSNLESNATTLIRTKGIDGEDHDVHLAEVIDEHTIRVEEDLSAWIGSLDESGNVVSGNQLFVYGQEVDDFVYLNKDAIWTVATSALQEVDRQLQDTKAQLASVLARLDALENP